MPVKDNASVHLKGLPSYGLYRFHFYGGAAVALPAHPGSAWRGAFGRALREAVCIVDGGDCGRCLVGTACPYRFLFETPAVNASGKGITTHAPHPIVLTASGTPGEGNRYIVEVTLIGEGNDHIAAVVLALSRAAAGGIAGRRNRLALDSVEQFDGHLWRTIYRAGGAVVPLPIQELETPPRPEGLVQVAFTYPLRIKHRGRLVDAQSFSPQRLIQALYQRFFHLCQLPGSGGPAPEPWPTVSPEESFEYADLRWEERDRYSSRQGRKHKVGGLLGRVVLDMGRFEEAWPLLWHGQFLHLGKLTSMGHGGYRVSATSLQDNSHRIEANSLRELGEVIKKPKPEGTTA